jgi:hypothetical protein
LIVGAHPVTAAALSTPDDIAIDVDDCGAACDCCWWVRVECAVWSDRRLRKVGDRFVVFAAPQATTTL